MQLEKEEDLKPIELSFFNFFFSLYHFLEEHFHTLSSIELFSEHNNFLNKFYRVP